MMKYIWYTCLFYVENLRLWEILDSRLNHKYDAEEKKKKMF